MSRWGCTLAIPTLPCPSSLTCKRLTISFAIDSIHMTATPNPRNASACKVQHTRHQHHTFRTLFALFSKNRPPLLTSPIGSVSKPYCHITNSARYFYFKIMACCSVYHCVNSDRLKNMQNMVMDPFCLLFIDTMLN